MSTIFDVAVMGGGPGGYVAALRAAQNGLSVVCIDDGVNAQGEPSPGGTCLNVGCIPSKSLLQSSEVNDQHIHARNVVIATGSQPRQLPGVTIDNQQILDNRGALALSEVPPRLGVIGAGVIGLELGSVWNRVGSGRCACALAAG